MIPTSVDYVRPTSLSEALEMLASDTSTPIAGGHSLLPILKLRLALPQVLVDVGRLLPRGVTNEEHASVVGAATTWRDLLETAFPPSHALIHQCVGGIGDVQVRNYGTVGGSIAHADPSSDFAAVLLATGARLRLVSQEGVREIAIEDFYLGPYTTALGAGELIEAVVLPESPGFETSSYVALEDAASGYPIAGAAVAIANPQVAEGSKIALTGVADMPRRLLHAETALRGDSLDMLDEAVGRDLEGMTVLDEVRWSADYRSQITRVVVRRALRQALPEGREEG